MEDLVQWCCRAADCCECEALRIDDFGWWLCGLDACSVHPVPPGCHWEGACSWQNFGRLLDPGPDSWTSEVQLDQQNLIDPTHSTGGSAGEFASIAGSAQGGSDPTRVVRRPNFLDVEVARPALVTATVPPLPLFASIPRRMHETIAQFVPARGVTRNHTSGDAPASSVPGSVSEACTKVRATGGGTLADDPTHAVIPEKHDKKSGSKSGSSKDHAGKNRRTATRP